jgi:hypothetical protein
MEEDLKCPLCFKVLFAPVTTECGHTYCKSCIEKSFQAYKFCPICRKGLGSLLRVNQSFVLQNIVEKRFPEEVKNRREEEKEKEKVKNLKPTTLPVVFVKDFVTFPGTTFYMDLEEEKYQILFQNLQPGKSFSVISNVCSQWISWASTFKSFQQLDRKTVVSATCTSRMDPVILRRIDPPQYSLTLSELSLSQLHDQSLYEVPNTILPDIPCQIDPDLESSVLSFTESCISKLTERESISLRTFSSKSSITSFFILTVLNLPLDQQVKAFKSDSENSRLLIINSFTQNKTPCRNHTKISKTSSSSFPLYAFLFVLVLIIISKIFS